MHIWATPALNELLLEKGLPVTISAEQEIRQAFLQSAAVCDMAIMPLENGYREFLAKAKAKGIHGPILFIAEDSAAAKTEFNGHFAYIFDQKRMGLAELKKTVGFILSLSLSRIPAEISQPFSEEECSCVTADGPKEADVDIRETLATLLKDGTRIVVAYQILEEGEPVTVRGTCFLKTLSDTTMVLGRFKPIPLLQGLKQGMQIAMLFTLGENRYHAAINCAGIGDDELTADVPARLFFVRRRYFRVEPSPPTPVRISILLPHEPTTLLKALEVSQRGISFIGTGALELGRVYAFTIMLPDPSALIGSYGIIRSRKENDNGFRYGAELHIHPKDEDNIARYIMRRELQILSLLG